MSNLFDIACNFSSERFDNDLENVLARAKENNVNKFLIVSASLEDVKKVYSIYKNNIDECFPKKNEIIKNLSNLLKNINWEERNYENEKAIYKNTFAILETGETIVVSCYDWSLKTENDKNWIDHLRVSIDTKEFIYWVNNIEHK